MTDKKKENYFLRMISNPVFLIIYAVFWFHLYSLCRFGRMAKNIPVLLLCTACFVLYVILYLIWVHQHKKHKAWEIPAVCRKIWKWPVLLALIVCTVAGAYKVVWSGIPYNGKLAWFLEDLQNKRTVVLQEEHRNVYRNGVEGFFEDVDRKVGLPEKLCLATSFNMHFLKDGTIDTVDTMLLGFDEKGNCVGSYLITYNQSKSHKITIYLNDAAGKQWDEKKDIRPLIEAVSCIDLKETVKAWDQNEYGVLYYGLREWNDTAENLMWLNGAKETWKLQGTGRMVSAYSVSVFCPLKEEQAPIRFLYDKAAQNAEAEEEPSQTAASGESGRPGNPQPSADIDLPPLEEAVKKQLQVFARHRDEILYDMESAGTIYACYTVYDLDMDGKLELISTINMGTGRYSYNTIHQVNDTLDGIVELEQVYLYGTDSEFDLGDTVTQAYEADGRIYYPAWDYLRDGIFGGTRTDGAFYLEEDVVYFEVYRREEIRYSQDESEGKAEEHSYYGIGDDYQEISEKEFEARKEEFWKGKTPIECHMRWFSVELSDLSSISEQEFFAMLAECYVSGM